MSGLLIYVMGPSGAGKDTLLDFARAHLGAEDGLVFAHRYITRPFDAGGENHVALSGQEFATRAAAGLFSLHWTSHGNRYGLGLEIESWLGQGLNVVMNGSRGYLAEAMARRPEIVPLLVTVDPEALRRRLLERGRESAQAVERRLARLRSYAAPGPEMHVHDNTPELSESGPRFVALLRAICAGDRGHAALAARSQPGPDRLQNGE